MHESPGGTVVGEQISQTSDPVGILYRSGYHPQGDEDGS